MKIAVTADCHLDDGKVHPERYEALEEILHGLSSAGVENLLVAGDLFDSSIQDYSRFDALCRRYAGVFLHVIPGNHDARLSERAVTAENVAVYTRPTLSTLGDLPFLFLPYREGVRMGEAAAEVDPLPGGRWVLVGHGDSSAASRIGNAYEEGTYMPLSSAEMRELNPSVALLGHIHKPFDSGRLHYPGSPCGMDINETGPRRYLLLDSQTLSVTEQTLDSGMVFLQARYVVIPEEGALKRLDEQIEQTLSRWEDQVPGLRERARVRVVAAGYTEDRRGVFQCLRSGFSHLSFYNDEEPDVSGLRESVDLQRSALASRVRELVDDLEWPFGGTEPERREVLQQALELIYGQGQR